MSKSALQSLDKVGTKGSVVEEWDDEEDEEENDDAPRIVLGKNGKPLGIIKDRTKKGYAGLLGSYLRRGNGGLILNTKQPIQIYTFHIYALSNSPSTFFPFFSRR